MAEEKESGVFFDIGPGVNFAQDVDVEIEGFSGEAELDPGLRVGASVGYQINRYLGVEVDGAYVWNPFDDSDSSLTHVPLIANAVLRFPIARLEPYVGAGVGGSANVLAIRDFDEDFDEDDADADFNFAWQAMAGLRFRFHENMSVGVGYKYLGTSESDYEIEGVDVKIGTAHNHTVNAAFHMLF
jgi:opacity protein-like surface antigen